MADPRIKTLKIKTGVVRRLAKEKVMYEKEADGQKNRVQKFKDEGRVDRLVISKEFVGTLKIISLRGNLGLYCFHLPHLNYG